MVAEGAGTTDFWPRHFRDHFRCIVGSCDATGVVHSFQGVNLEDWSKRFPRGIENRGLVFADKRTRNLLRSREPIKQLVVVEGVIDFLTALTLWGVPTIGIFPGSDSVLPELVLDDDAAVYFGTHLDAGAGLAYQDRVSSLLRHPVRRIPFEVASEGSE